MKKATKVWLVTAVSLIALGSILFLGVMTMLRWDFSKLSTEHYETNTHALTDSFQNIAVSADTADIAFVPCDAKDQAVVCYEDTNAKHLVNISDNTLSITASDDRRWYHHIGIAFRTPSITVYLPEGEYGQLIVNSHTGNITVPDSYIFDRMDIEQTTGNITNRACVKNDLCLKVSTGDIVAENIKAASLSLTASTGTITVNDASCEGDATVKISTGKAFLNNMQCGNLISDGNTGDLSLTNVIASESFFITRSTGDVVFTDCDAAALTVETDTGDIKGSLLSEKQFRTQTDTGRVRVPSSDSGGLCTVTTSTGDIIITV